MPLVYQSGAVLFETGSHMAKIGLKIAMQPRMALNFQFSCLYPPRAGITDRYHHILWCEGSNQGFVHARPTLLSKLQPRFPV